jgi:hypothetical protein
MAEKRIRDLQDQTTTMLLHAESKWPDVILANLWPYALREAKETLNANPNKVKGKVANQVFASSDTPTVLRHFHPFGCPTYVLNDNLASGKSIPKWHKRARLGVYLGRSPNHAQSIALVMNLATGLMSPHYHMKFDDLFETVKEQATYPNRWKVATHFRKEGQKGVTGKDPLRRTTAKPERGPEVPHSFEGPREETDDPQGKVIPGDGALSEPAAEEEVAMANAGAPRQDAREGEAQPESDVLNVRRWSRRHKPTRRLIESQAQAAANHSAYLATNQSIPSNPFEGNDYDADVYHGVEEYEIQRQMTDPIAFAASSDPDIMYLHEAMKQDDKKEFVQAMVDEVTTHTEKGQWKIIPISDVPSGTKILPAVWALGNAPKEADTHQRDLQVEGKIERSWGQTDSRF